ncbi:hypothetical protein [Intrasporangium sp. YIM S08009]|uniref:hypothetical protein n=1 Tax=Intrasporangium zincisolvens TaxID=3080018 RepID=UPI002B0592AD|nr:hypothetical protein [Intrasporangium sp. YIM S08009]
MRYEVDPTTVGDAAAEIEAALARLASIRADLVVAAVSSGLPSGEAAASTPRLVEAWRDRFRDARLELLGLGSALGAASSLYEAVERTAAASLSDGSAGGAP